MEESSVLLSMDGLNTRGLPPEGREPRGWGKLDIVGAPLYEYSIIYSGVLEKKKRALLSSSLVSLGTVSVSAYGAFSSVRDEGSITRNTIRVALFGLFFSAPIRFPQSSGVIDHWGFFDRMAEDVGFGPT